MRLKVCKGYHTFLTYVCGLLIFIIVYLYQTLLKNARQINSHQNLFPDFQSQFTQFKSIFLWTSLNMRKSKPRI